MNREEAKRERVVPMDPAIKKVAIVIALALIVVLGLIFANQGAGGKDAPVATESSVQIAQEPAQTQKTAEANAENKPEEEAKASEVSKTDEAQIDEDAQAIEMYEGALAGLSEDEIAKMALAEESGSARTEAAGMETAMD
jgi:hypothetical protein